MNILVLVDCQNDFIDGSLGVGYPKWEKAWNAIEKSVEKLNPDLLVVTKDMHPENHCSFKEQDGPWPAHCIEGTSGSSLYWKAADLVHKYETMDKVDIIHKGQNPAEEEYGVDILGRLSDSAKKKIDDLPKDEIINIYLTGLCYDYCVYNCAKETATVNSVLEMNQTLTIIRDATAAIDENAELDLDTYNIKIINSEDL